MIFGITMSETKICTPEMLSDMHEKLSQAVKLYDQLLTQQVSQPRWRPSLPAMAPNVSDEKANPGYNPRHSSVNQWSPVQSQAPPTSEVLETARRQTQYQAPTSPVQEYRTVTGDPATTVVPAQTYSVAASPQQQQYQQPQWVQYQQPSAPNQVPPMSHGLQQPATSSQQPQRVNVSSLGAPQLQASQHQVPITQPSQPQADFHYWNPTPVIAPQQHAPSPPQSFVNVKSHPPSATSLSRHNTVSSYLTSPPAANSLVSRHHTVVIHAPTRQQAQHAQPVSPPSLPQFPAVPTAPPQSFSMYSAPTAPSGFPQKERKEALLIDL